MNRAIGFNAGQRGDLIISTAVARAFKESNPDWHLTLGLGAPYKDMEPLFHAHPYFDAVHTYTSYDKWPSEFDTAYLEAAKYDAVFNPMPPIRNDWFVHGHQVAEVALLRGLEPSDLSCTLAPWFGIEYHPRRVAFAPFAGWVAGKVNDKQLTQDRAQAIVNLLIAKGMEVLHLGAPDEPRLNGTIRLNSCYFDSVRAMLGCKFLFHTDSGLGWVASAYRHPQLGLYGHRYYGEQYVKHIQPVNSKALYLDAPTVADISMERIAAAVDTLL